MVKRVPRGQSSQDRARGSLGPPRQTQTAFLWRVQPRAPPSAQPTCVPGPWGSVRVTPGRSRLRARGRLGSQQSQGLALASAAPRLPSSHPGLSPAGQQLTLKAGQKRKAPEETPCPAKVRGRVPAARGSAHGHGEERRPCEVLWG